MSYSGPPTSVDYVDLPSGDEPGVVVRTFLIADVRGYTRFTQEHGDEEAGKLAARFAALVRDAVTATGGEVVELRGDEALCAFPSARQALRAAVELQVRFRTRVEGEPVFPLGIGIGLDAGEAVPVEGGYRGGALNLAARLCSLAAPGQILASETVASLSRKLAGVRFVERRGVRVKGLEKPVRAIEVIPEVELPPLPEAPRPSGRRRGFLVLTAGAIVLTAALAAAVLAITRDSDGTLLPVGNAIAPNSVAVIDPRTGRVVDGIAVGRAPGPIAVGEGAVWVGNADDRTVSRIDPKTRTVVTTIGLGIEPTGLAVANGAVWVAGGFDQALVRIDTADNVVRLRRTVRPKLGPLPAGYERGPSAVAVGAGAVWLAHGEEVSRIDPRTARVLATIPAGGSWSGSIAFGEGAVWVPESASKKTRQRKDDDDDGVSRIDPASNAVAVTIPVVATPRGLAVGEGSVWAVVPGNDTLWQIDPQANRVARTLNAGWDPWGVAVGEGAVWIENDNDRTVSRIDPRSGELSATIDVGNPLEDIAAGEGAVWVSVR